MGLVSHSTSTLSHVIAYCLTLGAVVPLCLVNQVSLRSVSAVRSQVCCWNLLYVLVYSSVLVKCIFNDLLFIRGSGGIIPVCAIGVTQIIILITIYDG